MTLFKCCDFQGKDFFLDFSDPKKLVQCQWKSLAPRYYVTYRLILAIYTISIMCFILTNRPEYTYVFFTNWGYTCLTLKCIIQFIAVLKYYSWLPQKSSDCARRPLLENAANTTNKELPTFLQALWLISNVASSCGLLISLVFWTVLFPYIKTANHETIQAHGINVVIILLDLWVTSLPVYMAHVYQPYCFLTLYVVFNAFYWAAGGISPFGTKAIYPILNWDKGIIVGVSAIVLSIVMIIIQALLVLFVRLRNYCGRDKPNRLDSSELVDSTI